MVQHALLGVVYQGRVGDYGMSFVEELDDRVDVAHSAGEVQWRFAPQVAEVDVSFGLHLAAAFEHVAGAEA